MKRALLTGASGNIGRVLARRLSESGWQLILQCHLNFDPIQNVKGAKIIQKDLSLPCSASELVEDVYEYCDSVNLFVHMASFFKQTKLGHVNEEQWERILRVDLRSAFFISQGIGMWMKENDGGAIVLMSDQSADDPYSSYLPYCIGKAGINCLVKGLHKAMSPAVRVNAIAPYVVTKPGGMSEETWSRVQKKAPRGRATSPEEIADLVLELSDSNRSGEIVKV